MNFTRSSTAAMSSWSISGHHGVALAARFPPYSRGYPTPKDSTASSTTRLTPMSRRELLRRSVSGPCQPSPSFTRATKWTNLWGLAPNVYNSFLPGPYPNKPSSQMLGIEHLKGGCAFRCLFCVAVGREPWDASVYFLGNKFIAWTQSLNVPY